MKLRSFHQLSVLLKPYRTEMILCVFLSFLPAYFTAWNPFLMGRLIDEGLIRRDTEFLVYLGALLLFSRLMQFLGNLFVNYCLSAFGLQILVDYREFLLSKLLRYPISFFDKMSSGKITTRLTSDINSLQELFSSALVPLAGNLLLMMGVLVGMFVIHWELALISCLVLPLLIFATYVFHDRIRRRFGFMRQAVSFLNSFSAESLAGSRDIQCFGAIQGNQEEFDRYSVKLQKRNLEAIREYAYYNPLVPLITSVMDVLIIGFGGWKIYQGSMSVGDLVAFLGYANHFGYPIRDFAEKYAVLQQAMASVDRLTEVASHAAEADKGRMPFVPGDIHFDQIEFTYADSKKPALRNLSFQVKTGQKIALLGETGSGKTTTCSLLMRFYVAQKGRITIGGHSLQDFSLDTFRAQVGWVSQDVVLFSENLRENIRFFDSSITDQAIWEVLDLVQLKTWAEDLPAGLDEKLSERGTSFSSGQRQLISLARALVQRPSILIFDEATSYIDSRTEWQLQRALESLWQDDRFKSMTAFFIAHRLSTLKKCNQMLVFKDGEVVESGTFDDLMRLNGYAARLYSQQLKESA